MPERHVLPPVLARKIPAIRGLSNSRNIPRGPRRTVPPVQDVGSFQHVHRRVYQLGAGTS